MANIFALFTGSKFPKTEKYENEYKHLIEDFERFNKIEKSDSLSRYFELDTLIHSGNFEAQVKKLKKEKFKDTEAFHQYKKYKEANNSKNVKKYNKYISKAVGQRIKELSKSNEVLTFLDLRTYIESNEFTDIQASTPNKKEFKKTEAFQKLKQFNVSKRSSNVKAYLKFINNGVPEEIEELTNSNEIKKYLELKTYVESKEFADIKTEVTDKKRFEKSKEYQLIEEFKALQKSEDIVWYLKTKEANPFKSINKWHLTFEDDFNTTKLDESKWITGYFWGKALLNDNYVQVNEKQFFKDENIELRDSCARIVSKNETCQGKIWDPKFGFIPQTFDYSSGLISTGQSFRQKYGRFEAKIKFSHTAPAAHTFWLLAEKVTPQINILKSPEKDKNKIEVGNFWNTNKHIEQKTEKIKIPGDSDQFFIYTLDWTKDKLEWKINGVPVHTQTQNVPQVPMYISFSTHFTDIPDTNNLPISMDIDWVRCYQLN